MARKSIVCVLLALPAIVSAFLQGHANFPVFQNLARYTLAQQRAGRAHAQPPVGRRQVSFTGLRGAKCEEDMEQKAAMKLLKLAASTNRGQSATADQKYDIENAISDLEGSASIILKMKMADNAVLNGKWNLVYASERETRSSPFFWAFRKALAGVQQPIPVLPAELSESFFAITDGLPFYTVGRATQTISGVGTPAAQLVSSVQVTIRVFDALLPQLDGHVTTTSDYAAVGGNKAELTVKTTEVKDSTLLQLPVVGQLMQDIKFPTMQTLEQFKPGSSVVELEHTYLSSTMRIARNKNGQVFVYVKDNAQDAWTSDFDEEFGADTDSDAGTSSKDSGRQWQKFDSKPSSPSSGGSRGGRAAVEAAVGGGAVAAAATSRIDLGLMGEAFSGDDVDVGAGARKPKGGISWVEFSEFSQDVSPD